MSKAQDSLPASNSQLANHTQRAASATVSNNPVVSLEMAQSQAWGEPGRGDSAGSGGHTLLSRPPLQQARRSLFRR